jgi:hypothetical protein
MLDTPPLRPAKRDDVIQSLAFALRFDGRRRVHTADEMMSLITAERLVDYLKVAGYAVMQKPPMGHGTAGDST